MSEPLLRAHRMGDGPGLARVGLDGAAWYARVDPARFHGPAPGGLADSLEGLALRAAEQDAWRRVAEADGWGGRPRLGSPAGRRARRALADAARCGPRPSDGTVGWVHAEGAVGRRDE
jgi:hypothetical protein